jgi:PAS domain S-box-containing protein
MVTIRARIIVAALIVIAIVEAASVVYVIGRERTAAVHRLHDEIAEVDRLLQVVTPGPLHERDVVQLDAVLDAIFANPNVLGVDLKETRGDIALARQRSTPDDGGQRIERDITVLRRGDELGRVRVVFTTANIERRLAESRNVVALFSIVLMAVLAAAIYWLASRLTAPIERLTRAARQIAEGNLEREIDARGARELAMLGESFVRMRDAVRDKMSDLAEKNRQLLVQIEERGRAEAGLRESGERLRQAVRVADIGIFDHDHDAGTIYWSPELREIYGVGADEPITLQVFLKSVHPADLARIGAAVARAHDPAGNGLFDVEHRIVRPDGSGRWISQRSQTFFAGEGAARHPVRTVGAVVDVTERRAAEEMRALLAAVVQTSSDAILVTTAEREIVSWNAAAERMFGWTAAEAVGRQQALIVPPDLRHEPDRNTQLLIEGKVPATFETERQTKDGRRIHVQISLSGIYDDQGALTRVAGIFRDITERKAAEVERARLAAIVESSGDAIIGRDVDGKVLTWNAAAERLFGYTAAEMIGQDVGLIIPPNEHEQVTRRRALLAAGGMLPSYDTVRIAKDGRRIDVSVTLSPIRDHAGELMGVSLTLRDISDRKRAEQALRDSEAKISEAYATLNDAIESAPAAIAIYDAADKLIAWNSGFKALFAFDAELVRAGVGFETLSRRFVETGQIARPRLVGDDWLRERFRSHRQPGKPIEVQLTDGRWMQITETRAQSGGIVTVYSDVTALKEREEELRRLNEELERKVAERTAELAAANKELEAFAYSVSHDLRAPLRSMDGFSHLLLEQYGTKLDAEARRMLERIRAGAQRMGQLIADMLELSRVSRSAVRRVEVDLTALANAVIQELRGEAAGRNVQWRVAPGMKARGDPGLLRIALANLLGNALKYTRNRSPAQIEFGASGRRDGLAEFFVRDNGAGFDMAYAGRLFQPFQRLHAAHEFEGTGIGLATVQRVLAKHGGEIRGESRPDEGATFYFTLPA